MSAGGTDVREGGCRCGAIRYRASAKTIWTAHCHCDDCRHSCGAALATWLSVAEAGFVYEAGRAAEHRSSPGVKREFCPDCGTPLTFRAERWPGEVHVMVGTFDLPQRVSPERHVWTDFQLPWLCMTDDLPRFPRGSREGGAYRGPDSLSAENVAPGEVPREGGCRCGGVRYRVSAKPLWVTHCHCDDCRRSCGAAVATFIGMEAKNFTVLSGAPRIHRSSPGVRRSFCADCGTPLTYTADYCPNEVHLMIGTFDAPHSFKPGSHVFTEYQLPWLHMDDGLRRFSRLPKDVPELSKKT